MSKVISSLFWGGEAFNGEMIRQYSNSEGVAPVDFEKQIWQYETLYVLKKLSPLNLYFKGGSCIQTYLPVDNQRFSVDLDFNIETAERSLEGLIEEIESINNALDSKGVLVPISETDYSGSENIVYGKFYIDFFDSKSGTLSCNRIFPTKVLRKNRVSYNRLTDEVPSELLTGQFNHMRVQINLKHELFAVSYNESPIVMRITKYPEYAKELVFPRLSIGDLFCDKIFAIASRESFKDLFDLGMLVSQVDEAELNVCREKMETLYPDLWREVTNKALGVVESMYREGRYRAHITGIPYSTIDKVDDKLFFDNIINGLRKVLGKLSDGMSSLDSTKGT